MPKDKFKPNFDPVWQSDYLDIRLKKLSRTAFIMRQMYRSYRDPKTNLCKLSDPQIRSITGWDRESIQKAREQLIALGEIIPTGYRSYAVKAFHQIQESCRESRQPDQEPSVGKADNHLSEKPTSLVGKADNHLSGKPTTLISPIYTDTDRHIEKTKSFICKNCQNYNTEHIDSRGNKAGYCPILKVNLPPSLNASACENFFVRGVEISQQKAESGQE